MRRVAVAVLAVLGGALVACSGETGAFTGDVNVHPCTVLTADDAATILGGPVVEPSRSYRRGRFGSKLDDCLVERVDDDEAYLQLAFGEDTIQQLPGESGSKPIDGLGKAAWWSEYLGELIVSVQSEDDVHLYLDVYLPGGHPAEAVERVKQVMTGVLARLHEELPGTDSARDLPEAPVDVCDLLTAGEVAATVGPTPHRAMWTNVGGRYGGAWLCAYWVDRADSDYNNAVNVLLTRDAPTQEDMAASMNRGVPVADVGTFAYWEPREEAADQYGGTLCVLTAKGQYVEIWVGLGDPAREQPEAIRLANLVISRL